MKKLNKAKTAKLFDVMSSAKASLLKLDSKQKAALEKGWDIEHAYYSSALEGSNIDRKEFEKLGEKIT